MRSERGITMVELLVVVATIAVVAGVTASYSAPWLARESMHGATYDVHGLMQLARIEAVSRNHDSRFVIDTILGRAQVWDSMGTVTASDDVLLHERAVSDSVVFDRPDVGPAVTIEAIGGTGAYQTVFSSDGTVSGGTGGVYIHGGDGFNAVLVRAAGAVEIARWNGVEWQVG